MNHRHAAQRMMFGCATALVIGLFVAGCAPEPNEVPEDHAKDKAGTSWSETTTEEEKVTTLPDTFPTEEIKLPEDVTIDNAGTRGDSTWFVSLRTEDLESAHDLRDEIAKNSNLEVDGEVEATGDGGEQLSYLSPRYFVDTLTQTYEDSALLNIDIDRATG